MQSAIANDLKNYSKKDLQLLAKYYKLDPNLDTNVLLIKLAKEIEEPFRKNPWSEYCTLDYKGLLKRTQIQLLYELCTGKELCDLTIGLTQIGNPSSLAKVYNYNPTENVRAVIKVVPKTLNTIRDTQFSQLLSDMPMFPRIFLTGECNNKLYIVMEKLDMTLADLIKENVPASTIKNIISDVLDAIDVMMENGIVHTDLKPENIMVRCTGKDNYQTVIIDFDLVCDPNRNFTNYKLFDVYDFMRRLHDTQALEFYYPVIHKKVTNIYLKYENNDKKTLQTDKAATFKNKFK